MLGGAHTFICWPGMPVAVVGVAAALAPLPKLNAAPFVGGAGLPKTIDGVELPALVPKENGLLATLLLLACGDVMPPKANGTLALVVLLLVGLLALKEKPPGLACCWFCTADTALPNRLPPGFVALLAVALLPNVKSF